MSEGFENIHITADDIDMYDRGWSLVPGYRIPENIEEYIDAMINITLKMTEYSVDFHVYHTIPHDEYYIKLWLYKKRIKYYLQKERMISCIEDQMYSMINEEFPEGFSIPEELSLYQCQH